MSNYITISTIGILPEIADEYLNNNYTSKRMIKHLDTQINQVLPNEPDIIILPELCDRIAGISFDKLLEFEYKSRESLFNFISTKAKQNHCYIAYPTLGIFHDDNRLYNCCYLIDRTGNIVGVYKKNHLVIPEMKEWGLSCGTEASVFECDFGKVACVICFDLNFEQLLNKYVHLKPDLIIFPSMFHGGLMQEWWAYKCRCHFASSISCSGIFSEIRNPHGHIIASSTNYKNDATASINLDCQLVHLDGNFSKLAQLKNRYKKEVRISDPGFFGSVVVYSESSLMTVKQFLSEFQIETLDNYLERSLEYQNNQKSDR